MKNFKTSGSLCLNNRWIAFLSIIFCSAFLVGSGNALFAQGCCAGGSGNPMVGGASPGVLSYQQMEISSNFQYINSNRFKAKNKDVDALFHEYKTQYLYSKIGYGFTKEFTMSVELGYFFNKSQVSLDQSNTIATSGISDLILFPRYNLYSKVDSTKRWDITVGLGYKMPLGKNDVQTISYINPVTGFTLYTTAPPLVQPTTGSHDFIFYGFALRGFPKHNFRVFANATYISKGYNSLGEKFGDFSSVGLFAAKTFKNKIGLTLQLRGENIAQMRQAKNVDLLAMYNVDTASTGNKRLLLVPQISYNIKQITCFALYEYPLYEYVFGSQVATKTQLTVGLSYRFFTTKNPVCETDPNATYYECPMKCEGIRTTKAGKCKICGMDMVKVPQ